MENKFKNKLISALRKISYTYKPRNDALNKKKVDAATFECSKCGVYLYKGSSDANYNKIVTKYIDRVVLREVPKLDHIIPVVDVEKGWTSWDDFINRMFCEELGFQVLCFDCHDIKTKEENLKRKAYRDSKKSTK